MAPAASGSGMRLIAAFMWMFAAGFSLLLTLGNISLVGFQQKAQAALSDANLRQDIYQAGPLPSPTSWVFGCLSEGLLVRKELQLKQLDLMFGHEALSETQTRLENAHAFLRDYLKCNPSDGTAWLAAAMVTNTINNDSDITMQYLALSKFYTPNSENAIKSRAAVLTNVSARLKSGYRDLSLETVPLSETKPTN